MYKFRVERGRNLILSTQTMVLSRSDSLDFIETLNNPPEPSDSLKEAAKAYDELIDDRGLDFDVEDTYNIQGKVLKSKLEEE